MTGNLEKCRRKIRRKSKEEIEGGLRNSRLDGRTLVKLSKEFNI